MFAAWFFAFVRTAAAADDGEPIIVEDPGLNPRSAAGSLTVVEVDATLSATGDVGAALRRVPGAVVSRTGGLGDLTQVSLRGTTARQVELRVDGVPLNPDGTSAIDLSVLPLRAFSAVHAWRGVTPAWLGVHGPGGAVDLITGDGGPPARSAAAAGGSWGTFTARASASGRAGALVVDGLLTRGDFVAHDDRGTPYTPGDDVDVRRGNNDHRRLAALGVARLGRTRAVGLLTTQAEGVPGPLSRPTLGLRYAAHTGLLASATRWGGAGVGGSVGAFATGRWERLDDPAGELSGTPSVGAGGAGLVGVKTTVDALVSPAIRVRAAGSARVDVASDTGAAPGRFVGWVDAGLTGVVGRIRVEPGVSFGVLAPFAGAATVAPLPVLTAHARVSEAVSARIGVSRTFRPPDLFELYGDRGALRGNPDLRPEQAWAAELGMNAEIRTRAVDVDLDVAAYAREVTDLVTWVQNAQGVARPVNLDAARVLGAELGLEVDAGPWLRGGATVAVSSGRNLSTDAPIPRLPLVDAAPWLSLAWPGAARATWTTAVGSPMALDAAGVLIAPTRVVHTLAVRLEPVVRGAPALTVDISNLADRRAVSVPRNPFDPAAGTARVPQVDHLGYPLAGRTVLFGASWEGW